MKESIHTPPARRRIKVPQPKPNHKASQKGNAIQRHDYGSDAGSRGRDMPEMMARGNTSLKIALPLTPSNQFYSPQDMK